MVEVKNYRKTVKVPISVSWYQELVDDGKKGKDFYIRLSPHVNRGGKKGVPTLVKKDGVFWTKTGYENARINAELSSLANEIEKDTKTEAKKGLKQAMNKINRGGPTQQPQTAQNATINYTHEQALERTRRQHGISLEDQKVGEEERKRQQQSGKKVSTEEQVAELQKTYNTEEDAEIMRQLLGKSTSGYNAVIQDLNNTKVGFDDDEY